MYLSESIEAYKNKKDAANILSKVKAEVNDNRRIIEYWSPYHQEIKAKLDSLIKEESFVERFVESESALFQEVFSRNTIMSDLPSKDAWEIAKSHPLVVNFDYDQLLSLSKIYSQQEFTFKPISDIVNLMIAQGFNDKPVAKDNLDELRRQMREIVGREKQLLSYLDKAEQILGLEER